MRGLRRRLPTGARRGPAVVTADVKLAVLEIKWGLIPDMAGMVLMRGLVRDDVARELTYTGRIFGGEEAGAMGLATRVCADPRADRARARRRDRGQEPPTPSAPASGCST